MDARVVPTAGFAVERGNGETKLAFTGHLDVTNAGGIWNDVVGAAVRARGKPLLIELSQLTGCDTAGITLLLAAERAHGRDQHGAGTRFDGASPQVTELLKLISGVATEAARPRVPEPPPSFRFLCVSGLRTAIDGVAFLGEAAVAAIRLPTRPRMLRAAEFWRIADQAGVRAVPLVLLLGMLMGLILAFQSLIPLRRFGADIYVANLVGISLTRELGPLLTAVILSGRTGSAFAAEIGTMQVNQEIDALKTLDLDPMTILVLPRLFAAALVMPALTILLEIAGLLGMVIVLNAFGFPPVAVGNQVAAAVRTRDVWGGLFKATVFGCVVAAIGCKAGLSTGVGPRAVGLSATSAVVGGIVSTILLDGAFAILFYRIGV